MNIKFLEVKCTYYADPENVVVESNAGTNEWAAADPEYHGWRDDWQWRIRPRTIRIGEIDVPEPEKKEPKHGQEYYVASLAQGKAVRFTWSGLSCEKDYLRNHAVHLIEQSAQLHAKALIIVSGGKV